MSEFRITQKRALAGHDPIISDAIMLEALPEGHVIHVLAKPGDRSIEASLASLSDGTPHAVRATGPGQWFIVGNQPKTHRQLAELFSALQPGAFGVDQSAGRVRISARGPMVERVLTKGTAVDLAITNFPIGRATTTLIGHITAHITRVGDDAFEVTVLRGFAESLWDDLCRMSAAFA